MAREIKETPLLTGENAKHFERMLTANKSKKVSKAAHDRARSTYQAIMANSNIA